MLINKGGLNMEQVSIHTEYIKLSQFMKLAGLVSQGSDSKIYLAEGMVTVNGVVATERGKKIRNGDIVEVKNMGSAIVVVE